MTTTGFKFYFGLGMVLLVAGIVYGWTSGGADFGLIPGGLGTLFFQLMGALTFGWIGGVGDHLGYAILMGAAAVSFALAGFMVAFRDAEAKSLAEVAGTADAPPLRPVPSANWWGPLGAFGLVTVVLGIVVSPWLVLAGAVVLFLVALEWTMQAWAERATGDPATNAALRNRVMNPIEVPLVGVIVVLFIALGISRIYLAIPQFAATVLSSIVASIVFFGAVAFTAMRRPNNNILVAAIVVLCVGVLASGVVGAALGEREFHYYGHDAEHDADHGNDHGEDGDEGESE